MQTPGITQKQLHSLKTDSMQLDDACSCSQRAAVTLTGGFAARQKTQFGAKVTTAVYSRCTELMGRVIGRRDTALGTGFWGGKGGQVRCWGGGGTCSPWYHDRVGSTTYRVSKRRWARCVMLLYTFFSNPPQLGKPGALPKDTTSSLSLCKHPACNCCATSRTVPIQVQQEETKHSGFAESHYSIRHSMMHGTAQHRTVQHGTAQNSTAQHGTALQCITQHAGQHTAALA